MNTISARELNLRHLVEEYRARVERAWRVTRLGVKSAGQLAVFLDYRFAQALEIADELDVIPSLEAGEYPHYQGARLWPSDPNGWPRNAPVGESVDAPAKEVNAGAAGVFHRFLSTTAELERDSDAIAFWAALMLPGEVSEWAWEEMMDTLGSPEDVDRALRIESERTTPVPSVLSGLIRYLEFGQDLIELWPRLGGSGARRSLLYFYDVLMGVWHGRSLAAAARRIKESVAPGSIEEDHPLGVVARLEETAFSLREESEAFRSRYSAIEGARDTVLRRTEVQRELRFRKKDDSLVDPDSSLAELFELMNDPSTTLEEPPGLPESAIEKKARDNRGEESSESS